MRLAGRLAGLTVIASALSACGGGGSPKSDAADARAAASGFRPPAVTSRLDWGSQQERRFNELDRDVNGRLSAMELPRANSRILTYDRDRDGEVTKQEFSEGALARFDRMDLNDDGTVTSEEQETTRNGMATNAS